MRTGSRYQQTGSSKSTFYLSTNDAENFANFAGVLLGSMQDRQN